MSGYDKLILVDQYEEKHTNSAAVRRACDVMLDYLASLRRPLPEAAAQAVKAAREYSAGGADRLQDACAVVSRFLKHPADGDRGAISIVRASEALLKLLQVPVWGGGASEALSNFLELVDEYEQNHPLFEQLLERTFGESGPAS
jgi:hypothetical protein